MPEIRQAHMKWLSRKSGVSEMDARDGKLDGPAPTKIVRSDSAMKAVGSARKENRERLKLTKLLDRKLHDAATDCMSKMVASKITRQKQRWKDWSWIVGSSDGGLVEYHAMRRGDDGAPQGNYCAFNLIFEEGHPGDMEHLCGVAELSRPSACHTRWALLKWRLDLQLMDMLLGKLEEKERAVRPNPPPPARDRALGPGPMAHPSCGLGRQACQPTRSTMMLGAMVGDTLAGKIDDDSFDEAYENLSEYERLW